jgi:exosortase F-associated protein
LGEEIFVTTEAIMTRRFIIGTISMLGLLTAYLFQKVDVAQYLGVGEMFIHRFLINRTLRFLLNDLFMIGIIYALFGERKYVIFSIYVQFAGVVLFLIPYFILKILYPFYSGPLTSYLHRLVLNPTLLLLLIPAFYYQKKISGMHESKRK